MGLASRGRLEYEEYDRGALRSGSASRSRRRGSIHSGRQARAVLIQSLLVSKIRAGEARNPYQRLLVRDQRSQGHTFDSSSTGLHVGHDGPSVTTDRDGAVALQRRNMCLRSIRDRSETRVRDGLVVLPQCALGSRLASVRVQSREEIPSTHLLDLGLPRAPQRPPALHLRVRHLHVDRILHRVDVDDLRGVRSVRERRWDESTHISILDESNGASLLRLLLADASSVHAQSRGREGEGRPAEVQ